MGVSETAVGGRTVWVKESTVGVEGVVPVGEGIAGVVVPLQAATNNTSKRINRRMGYELLVIDICSICVDHIS
jgi:hypothetical protein